MLRDFSKALRDLWRVAGGPGGAYRPDLHYMRGPGPKWHAKYGHLYQNGAPKHGSDAPKLREIAERHV